MKGTVKILFRSIEKVVIHDQLLMGEDVCLLEFVLDYGGMNVPISKQGTLDKVELEIMSNIWIGFIL